MVPQVWEKNNRKTEAEMDGLCQPRDLSAIGTTKDEVDDRKEKYCGCGSPQCSDVYLSHALLNTESVRPLLRPTKSNETRVPALVGRFSTISCKWFADALRRIMMTFIEYVGLTCLG